MTPWIPTALSHVLKIILRAISEKLHRFPSLNSRRFLTSLSDARWPAAFVTDPSLKDLSANKPS